MKERLLKLAKFAGPVGYPLFYFFCLAVFAALTFPYGKLRERIVASFNAGQPPAGGAELQIEELSGYWLSGVAMKGVTVLRAPSEPNHPPTKLVIDEATARYALLPALVGNTSVSFDALAFGGEVKGTYDVNGKSTSLDVAFDTIDLGKIPPLVELLGVPLEGKLGGTIRLTLPEGKAAKGAGVVALEARDVAVGDAKAKIKGTIALPRVDVGTLTLAAEAKDGLLKVTKFVAVGRDLDVQGEGRIVMRDSPVESPIDMQLRFRINDAYRTKSDLTKSLFGAPGSNAPALLELADPKIKQAKRADGFYGWSVRGPLGRPDFNPAGGAPAAPLGTGAARSP